MTSHIEIPIQTDKKEHLIKESEIITKYAAILDSVDRTFSANNDKNFNLLMYKVIANEVKKTKEISKHSAPLIITKQKQQRKLMRSKKFASWSIAVSHEHQEQFRLVAISCISNDDMMHFPYDDMISERDFTKIWKVDNDFNIEKCEIEIEYGRIIQFLPKANGKAGDEASYEINNDKANEFTLILVKGLGIYKHHFFEYLSRYLIVPQSDIIRRYFLRCLNGPYLLIDTSGRDPNKNIELYDLKTNQLMNVFKRYKFVLSIMDREKPGAFAVSSDLKLLAYVAGIDLKIYLIENGLELSSLLCKNSGILNVDFMKFIFNNEKLLIFKDDKTRIYEFIPLETSGLVNQMTRIVIDPISENEPFTILNIRSYFNDNQIVWDKLDLTEHLKKSGLDPNWIQLNPSEYILTDSMPYAYGINDNNEIDKVLLTDLVQTNPRYYLGIEP
ncbi:5580_t:CDS:2 [Gigaspora margarita]|uniref:5580_t:CDS:1 n=1 Tax=Gigaspora margarita TaxID=4874 RepID=A0ABN7VUV7_GIGMA|nr:5580_t:CDS:2 [Gigaspora margarita]